ncbi:hypothetical protein [Laceyella putida]|uniref:DUF4181 domain-containing protein n=1 Tax=Laceyella putida TaxID=110101 RepID=A0ABW2RPR2_9BACL
MFLWSMFLAVVGAYCAFWRIWFLSKKVNSDVVDIIDKHTWLIQGSAYLVFVVIAKTFHLYTTEDGLWDLLMDAFLFSWIAGTAIFFYRLRVKVKKIQFVTVDWKYEWRVKNGGSENQKEHI